LEVCEREFNLWHPQKWRNAVGSP